ncbi:hypothetical protein D3C73_1380360 [compost metagenome]
MITQDIELKGIAERTAAVLSSAAAEYPPGYAMYLQAHLALISGGREWVLSGKAEDPALHGMLAHVQQAYLPDATLIVNWSGSDGDALHKLLPHLADKPAVDGQATAYECRNFACRAPVTNPEAVKELLRTGRRER